MKRYILYFLLGLILISSLAIGFLFLPFWQISEVIVEGYQILSPSKIIEMANIPKGENIIFINLSHARKKLKEVIQIKEFSIFRRLPGIIVIKIKERKPLAVAVIEGQSAVIDEEGIILSSTESPTAEALIQALDATGLPVITGLKKTSVKNNRLDPEITCAIELFKFLPSSKLQLEMGKIEDISLLVDDVLKVRLGEPKEIGEKMRVFRTLLPVIQGRWNEVEYVDVRFLNNPVVKFKRL